MSFDRPLVPKIDPYTGCRYVIDVDGSRWDAPRAPHQAVAKRQSWYRRTRVVAPFCALMAFGIGLSASTTPPETTTPGPTVTVETRRTVAGPVRTVTVTATPAAPAKAAAPAPDPRTEPKGPGTYLVGSDIAPGTWKTTGGSGCYYARSKDASGTLDSIITNHISSGASVVTIARTDGVFETSRCAEWVRSN
jgi:hypothetical protein